MRIVLLLIAMVATNVFGQKMVKNEYLQDAQLKNLVGYKLVVMRYEGVGDMKKYNEGLVEAAKAYWGHNKKDEIKLMSHSEIKANKGEKLAVLHVRPISQASASYDPTDRSHKLSMLTIALQSSSSLGSSMELIFMPIVSTGVNNTQAEVELTVKLFNNCITNYLSDPKGAKIDRFINSQVEKNCANTSKHTILFNADLLKKVEPADIKSNFSGATKTVNQAALDKAILANTDELVAVVMPEDLMASGVIQAVVFARVLIHAKTGEIFAFADYAMERAGEESITKGHLKTLGSCK